MIWLGHLFVVVFQDGSGDIIIFSIVKFICAWIQWCVMIFIGPPKSEVKMTEAVIGVRETQSDTERGEETMLTWPLLITQCSGPHRGNEQLASTELVDWLPPFVSALLFLLSLHSVKPCFSDAPVFTYFLSTCLYLKSNAFMLSWHDKTSGCPCYITCSWQRDHRHNNYNVM